MPDAWRLRTRRSKNHSRISFASALRHSHGWADLAWRQKWRTGDSGKLLPEFIGTCCGKRNQDNRVPGDQLWRLRLADRGSSVRGDLRKLIGDAQATIGVLQSP